MQKVSTKNWTLVTVSISNDDNHYSTSALTQMFKTFKTFTLRSDCIIYLWYLHHNQLCISMDPTLLIILILILFYDRSAPISSPLFSVFFFFVSFDDILLFGLGIYILKPPKVQMLSLSFQNSWFSLNKISKYFLSISLMIIRSV